MAVGGSFALRLAPEYTLGRRFQMALLSFAPGEVLVRGDEAVLESAEDYVAAVESAARHVKERLELRKARANCKGGTLELEVLGTIDCCRYPGTPKLYTAGASDYRLLQESLGVNSWICAALVYADRVLARGAPLGGQAKDLPWLAKVSLFSNVRGPGGGKGGGKKRKGAAVYSLDTLGSVLLGGAAGFLGGYRLGGGDQAEFYLLPEAPSQGYATLLDALSLGGPNKGPQGNLAGAASWLASIAPVSLEAAVGAVAAAKLAEAGGTAGGLGFRNVLGEAKLYLVRSGGKRPLAAEGLPLTDAYLEVPGPGAVQALLRLAWEAERRRRESGGALEAVAGCLNAALLDAASPCSSTGLQGCLRDLDSLAKSPSLWRGARGVAERAAEAEKEVYRSLSALLGRCGSWI